MINQRQPRIRDRPYLSFVRTKPCCICGDKSEACHIRAGSKEYDKPATGMADKPSDKWSVPMCRKHHTEQHSMNELVFWHTHKINPFRLATQLYYQAVIAGHSKPTIAKPKTKTKIASRGFPKSSRKIPSRKFGT